MGELLCIPRESVVPISDKEFRSRIRKLHALCSTNMPAERNWRRRRAKALQSLIEITRKSNRAQLQLAGSRKIVFIAVKIFYYFEDIGDESEGGAACSNWKRRRDRRMAKRCFHEILRSFAPEKSRELIDSLVDVIQQEKLWRREDLCGDLADGLLECGIDGAPIVDAFLDRLEAAAAVRVPDARAILRMLHQMLDAYFWPNNEETAVALERLLKLYRASITGERASGRPPYAALRKGLEVCVRRMVEHLKNAQLLAVVSRMCTWSLDEKISESALLDFGVTLEYAAQMHVSGLYEETLNPEIFPVLMRMLCSTNRHASLLGNRVLQRLLDRQNNRSQFDTPRIFFEGASFDLKLNSCNKEDKRFLQQNRQILHDSLVSSAINHCPVRTNLESTYCTICLLAVEVPCGFTAAALVCLAMNLQDMSLERSEAYREASYHVHATVIAIMSLLCWVHDAKVFYSYVNKIAMERAQWAPHLNPPLKSLYSFAVHHVLWDKPDLFFVDWEARYGLWKCFRLRDGQRVSSDGKANSARARVNA